MSKISKLQIIGVRSFDNTRAETIEFFLPLTLIVGVNGSGKTTIIEALKYATTGELPPNSATGGAWIRDPRLSGENEVRAQVKLALKNASGEEVVVTRSLQVTMKKATRTQKTLDATMKTRKPNGEGFSESSRMAEIDKFMPIHLGVSKAVLESVIFCHQDDSLWPMSAPSVLKKKFDDIFEAVKYTQVVDNIKVLRKNQVIELAKHKIILEQAKDAKIRGERANRQAEQLSEEIEELKKDITEVKEKEDDARKRSSEAFDREANFLKIVSELNGKRIEANAAEKSVHNLKQHMNVMKDSDEELREMQDKYEERLALHEEEKDTLTNRYRELAKGLQKNRDTLGSKQGDIGRLQAQKDQYERQIESRRDLIKKTANRHDVRGFDSDINDELVREFIERISRLAREQQKAFERARKETQEESQKTQQLLNSLNETRASLNQTKSSTASYINQNDAKIFRHQADLNKIDIDEGRKTILEDDISNLERRLRKGKSESETANWEGQIQTATNKLNELERSKDGLDTEMMEASRHAKDSAQLDFLRKSLKEQRGRLGTMTAAHGKSLTALLGPHWEPANLDQNYQDVLTERVSAIKEAERQRDSTSQDLRVVNMKMSTASKDLDDKRKELDKCHEIFKRLTNGTEPADYSEYLEDLEKELKVLRDENTNLAGFGQYFQLALSTADSHDCCRLCMRGFAAGEKSKFLKRLEKQLSNEAKDKVAKELADAEEWYSKAQEARSSYDTYVRLEKEITELKEQSRTSETQRSRLNDKLQEQDLTVNARVGAKGNLESDFRTIQSMHKIAMDVSTFESQIKELENVQGSANSSLRSLDTIQEEQKELSEQIRAINVQLNKLRADRDRSQQSIIGLEYEAQGARGRLAEADFQLKAKTGLQTQIEELKAQNTEQRDAIKNADRDIQALLPKISQAQASLEDIRNRGDERNKILQKAASNLTDSLHQLELADKEINAYLDRGVPQQLERATREISQIRVEITCIEKEQLQITIDMKEVEKTLQGHSETKRAIIDNLTYRENLRALQSLNQDIEQLKSYNAEADRERYAREGQKWQNETHKLSTQRSGMLGTITEKDRQLTKLIAEYDLDFKDAGAKYTKANVQVRVVEAAVADLAQYASALDKGIMKYHSAKMEEINRIIDELWRDTYQGTDVDTVMIRSENETQKGNKNYNYRVVMIKADAEMDMRGRCSAGQKVLASIIIRLALAECFGVRCGLIALDEPTTNLDQDNIRALAGSLAAILKARKHQANLQLVIITHDEEFLRYMNCGDFTDYYWRVDRNDEQCSQVRKQRIQDVM
ncbi:hypothetical protein EJ08DRAFT_614036 [Tothia fuscella]|uniref:DNA repair protein RAD50 n=1 Tax=Tothia fuscella TaxID=1048955 RepID=A0A9P4TY26_9PEZI|nr:hypothetical protein EJ08DRAFT_614036 [Tothia fuscella]